MRRIGYHVSFAGGYEKMGERILQAGANTAQYFLRNPRGGDVLNQDQDEMKAFEEFMKEKDIDDLLIHAPYTLNPCSNKLEVRDFAYRAMKEDLEILQGFTHTLYNFHPGNHLGQGVEKGIEYVSEFLNETLFEGQKTIVLLETMAGKGTEVGKTFEEINEIIKRVDLSKYVGVTMDTCHIWDAGYDIQTKLDEVLEEFDQIIGLNRLYAIHMNDSKNPCGSHKDRHEQLGKGYIGLETFEAILNHPLLKDIPIYLETPHEDISGYKEEILLLRQMIHE